MPRKAEPTHDSLLQNFIQQQRTRGPVRRPGRQPRHHRERASATRTGSDQPLGGRGAGAHRCGANAQHDVILRDARRGRRARVGGDGRRAVQGG